MRLALRAGRVHDIGADRPEHLVAYTIMMNGQHSIGPASIDLSIVNAPWAGCLYVSDPGDRDRITQARVPTIANLPSLDVKPLAPFGGIPDHEIRTVVLRGTDRSN